MQKRCFFFVALVWSAACLADHGSHHHASPNKTTPSKPATVQPTIKPASPPAQPTQPTPPSHVEHHNLPMLPRLVPVTKPSTTSTDPAECLRIGGNGHRNEYGQCMGWDGKPL